MATRKTSTKKTSTKKTSTKKTSTKKTSTKKASTKKASTKKASTKKTSEFSVLHEAAANRPLRSALSRVFDVNLTGASVGRSTRLWFRLPPEWEATEVASDGSGGVFAFCHRANGKGSRVIYVGSEGQSGTVATSVREWLALMIALPYWHDLLKFSRGGSLREMRRAGPSLERDTSRENPEVIEWRQRLFEELKLKRQQDPIGALHKNIVGGATLVVSAPEPCESLFGPFSVRDRVHSAR